MLKQLRSKTRIIMIVTFVVVVPSFIFFYGWGAMKGGQQQDQFDNDQAFATFIPPNSKDKVRIGYDEMRFAEWGKRDQVDNLISQSAMRSFSQQVQQGQATWDDFRPFVARQLQSLGGYEGLLPNEDLIVECKNQYVLQQYSDKNGIGVTKDEVMARISAEMGSADAQMFLNYLESRGVPNARANYMSYYTRREVLNRARQSLGNEAKVTLAELWEGYRYENGKLSIHHVALPVYKYSKQAQDEQTTATLQAFYDTHTKELEEPAKRIYAVAYLKSADMRREVTPTPEEIADYYAKNKANYDLPKRLYLRHVFFALQGASPAEKAASTSKTLQQAINLLPQLKTGDFAKLADQYSQDPNNEYKVKEKITKRGGELDWVNVERDVQKFGKDFIGAALLLKVGEVSAPIRTKGYQLDGYSVIKCEGIKEAGDQTLAEVEYRVRNDLIGELAQIKFEERVLELRSKVANATTISGVAKDLGMHDDKTTWTAVTSTNLKLDGGESIDVSDDDMMFINNSLKDMARTPLMMSATRPVQPGQPAPDRIAFVLEIAQAKEAMTPPLEEIKSKTESAYRQDVSQKLALADAKKLLADATDLASLPTTATELTTDTTLLAMEMATEAMGLKLSSTTLFSRTEVPSDIVLGGQMPEFVNQSMAVVRGDVRLTTATSAWMNDDRPTHYVVWHVTRLDEPSKEDFQKEVPNLRANSASRMGASIVEEWLLDRRRELVVVKEEEKK